VKVISRQWLVVSTTLCALLSFALCSSVAAQQAKKIHRIGFLIPSSTAMAAPYIEAFRQGMRDLGYIEGKNYVLEIREGGATRGRLSDLAAELIGLKIDVIVAAGNDTVQAVKETTSTIPIVMRYDADPIRRGIVDSLARPGGNITGLASLTTEIIGKRLELLAEVVPNVKRVTVLAAQTDQGRYKATTSYKELEAAARALGVKLEVLLARDPATIENAFVAMKTEHSQALIVIPSAAYIQHREHIFKHAVKNRLPAIYFQRIFVENGGLMSYGPDFADEFRRLAIYVDKILRGTKPADLPVEQPTKFELMVNLKTAKQIGLTIPPNVLARADKIIR
jgi:putative tryptophan/tyrosine transport system substrate-binding protein